MTLEDFKKKYIQETYLGDGLYAKFDGYHIVLRAPREEEDHWVALEPNVFENLLEYRKKLYEDAEKLTDNH